MGNQISLRSSSLKVVFCDGTVQEFDQPVTVAELMLEHPQQVVVEFHSAVNQKRPTPLPADKKLDMNKIYLMVPVKQGKPVGLSREETRLVMMMVNSALHSKYLLSSSRFIFPWFTGLCHSNAVVEPGPVGVEQKREEERNEFSEILTEILEERPEFLSRQISGKGSWKPSLDTIKEKNIDKKLTHWLFLKTF